MKAGLFILVSFLMKILEKCVIILIIYARLREVTVMYIREMFENKKVVMSAEVFPPKKNGMLEGVIRALKEIKPLDPDYVSITYGASGSGGQTTADVASVVIDAFDMTAVAHMTAVNMTKELLEERLAMLTRKGVKSILALRGDIVEGSKFYDFRHASELAAYISERYPDFELLGACYPEGHPEAKSLDADLDMIKLKTECGVSHLVSQLFFDNETFYDFMEKAEKKGIMATVSAGIMPITSVQQVERIVSMCGVQIPTAFAKICANYQGADLYNAGIDYAIGQIRDLIDHGVKGIHVYTMNKGDVARRIFDAFEGVRK